jgi:hypothetical protein
MPVGPELPEVAPVITHVNVSWPALGQLSLMAGFGTLMLFGPQEDCELLVLVQVIVGLILSFTVTVKLQLFELPAASFTV